MSGLVYGSVCSGIEAATVAWHPLGWRPSFFSEIEAAPRAVLQHRHPEVPLHGDFTTIREGQYGAIDLLVGGTPCQSFSVAGLRGGLADDRGNLALQYLSLARRLRPRWLVWENVPGVLSSNGGRDFGSILGGMVELGYGFAYRVLDAQYVRVDGFGRAVPQRRRRVFVVGHLGDWRRPAAVLFERACLRGDSAPSREAGKRPAPTLSARPSGGGCLGTDFDCDGGLIPAHFDVAHSLRAQPNPSHRADSDNYVGVSVSHALRGEGFDASEDGTGRGTPLIPVAGTVSAKWAKGTGGPAGDECQNLVAFDTTQITSTANYSRPQPGDPCHPLAAGAHAPCIAFSAKDDLRDASHELSPTLRCGGKEGGANWTAVTQGWAVRRLTPRECERLQGFPDDYTLVPWRGGLLPDGPRYKALGNSMAVNVMRWIGQRIEMVDAAAPHLAEVT
ncbi:DNA cytosine methyltransferase [Methylorubrum extorquens]|uniref:DNA cytosine methyltransferase n=1 Tax=Methylorubrum extorquens TaxID=408 RepID=UPI0002D8DBA2|nr:DNA cytosine methyltransferase [Methylorubrum extorquens]MCP1545332.1 DNA (cytosine-5)-methyltransferase 1 [Methylorubrum extorquens]MCP1587321.1 DNA (cytosine-5)-methyltransferase 1 [Methylorubrum extorquens]